MAMKEATNKNADQIVILVYITCMGIFLYRGHQFVLITT